MSKSLQPPASSLQQDRGGGDKESLDVLPIANCQLPIAPLKATSLRDRLAGALVYTALAISPVKIPFPRLDPAPPPAAVLPVGDPTPGIGVWRG
jgi:hypothetical protein